MPNQKFISQALELNLFFLRIMKEHAIFLEAAFTMKDKNLIAQADNFKNQFSKLLSNVIALSSGVLPSNVLNSNELVTQYTLDAERKTQAATGIFIDTTLTSRELSLIAGNNNKAIPNLDAKVSVLNQSALAAVKMFIQFKSKLKEDVLSCKIFVNTYPLLLEHVIEEAEYYRDMLTKLQNNTQADMVKDLVQIQVFFDEIMSEHGLFIRGLLDPTEEALFGIANTFAKEFEQLRKEAAAMLKMPSSIGPVTDKTIDKTTEFRNFKAQATEGILSCKIRSMISPLLADHVLREANYYLNLLKSSTI